MLTITIFTNILVVVREYQSGVMMGKEGSLCFIYARPFVNIIIGIIIAGLTSQSLHFQDNVYIIS